MHEKEESAPVRVDAADSFYMTLAYTTCGFLAAYKVSFLISILPTVRNSCVVLENLASWSLGYGPWPVLTFGLSSILGE